MHAWFRTFKHCIYMYACIYIQLHACMTRVAHEYVYIYVDRFVSAHPCMHARVRTCMYACMQLHNSLYSVQRTRLLFSEFLDFDLLLSETFVVSPCSGSIIIVPAWSTHCHTENTSPYFPMHALHDYTYLPDPLCKHFCVLN